ncbi:hypothetical protein [Marivirga arenosa]|uniref:Uncharacterized protein n=1 Tax=Marivirga arenosa TaxID=3059076 RepID=A0AA51ZXR3_9BACT|nr:hypothetical protein [Marivirga sp. BKB1-2]WNB18686.1 hypothetical protein QYS47_30975 [Marivirga sp. BKB1-2]
MSPDLLVDTVKYKNYFLVISGIYGGRTLTVLDNQLQEISEHDFTGIQMWDEEFHIDEENSKILISVITTETFPLESKKYQGFNTLWYELKEKSGTFKLELIDKWEKSDIKGIKSKIHNGERTWVALRELNYISQTGNKGKNSFIGIAQSSQLEIPTFEYSVSNQHSHLSQNFDIELTDKDIFISGIGSIAKDTPTILRIARNRKNMEFIELDIPLKKLHNFNDTVIKKINNQLFAYFWTTSSEYCKKYVFEIFTVRVMKSLDESTFEKAIDSDYVHTFTWSKNGVAYKTDKGSTPCRLGRIDTSGKIVQTEELETSHPELLTETGELIVAADDRKQLLKIK